MTQLPPQGRPQHKRKSTQETATIFSSFEVILPSGAVYATSTGRQAGAVRLSSGMASVATWRYVVKVNDHHSCVVHVQIGLMLKMKRMMMGMTQRSLKPSRSPGPRRAKLVAMAKRRRRSLELPESLSGDPFHTADAHACGDTDQTSTKKWMSKHT